MMGNFEDKLRQQKNNVLIYGVRQSNIAIVLILLVVMLLSWNIYKSTDKVIASDNVYGTSIGIHQIQRYIGSTSTILAVKLNDGEIVTAATPETFFVKINAKVEIIRYKMRQGGVYYQFNRYIGGK
jgi:hypothetical protein